jgi:hypothetical protein
MNVMLPILATLDHILHQNEDAMTKRLTQDDTAWRAPDPRGRNALWILGHVAAYRHRMLRLAGLEPPTTLWESHVQPGSDPSAMPASLRASTLGVVFQEAGSRLTARLAELDIAACDHHFGGTMPDGATTVFGALRCLVRHETWHCGQIGWILAT